jgi:uncharacterized protein (TIRG00374 family)
MCSSPAKSTAVSQGDPNVRRLSKRHRTLLRWLLAVVLLGLSVRLLWSNPEALRRLLSVRVEVLLGLAAQVVLNQWLMSWRVALAVEQCAGGRVFASWFRLTTVGQFLNLFVPQLGNVYRAAVLKREHGLPYTSYASSLLAVVWLDLLMGFIVALAVIALFDATLQFADLPAPLWLGGATLALLVAPFAAVGALRALRFEEGAAARFLTRITRVLSTSNSVLHRPRFLLRYFLINVLSTAGQVVGLWLSFHALGTDIGLTAMILFQVFLKLSNQIVITPGNLGLTELAFAGLAHASQLNAEQGVAASLLSRTVWTVVSIALGLAFGGGALLAGARRAAQLPDSSRTP